MAITYNWGIVTCEHDIATGGILIAHWKLTAVDGEYGESAIGVCSFSPDPAAEGFTPYNLVTEAQVLEWCWESEINKESLESLLAAKIEKKKNPVVGEGTPWGE